VALHIGRVLFADADPAVREVAHMSLRDVGRWAAHVVATGADVVRAAKHAAYDVVIIGEPLPDLDTAAIMSELAALPKPPPVLLLLEGDAGECADRAFGVGAQGFLRKPIGPMGLPDHIRKQLGADDGAGPGVLFRGR
jgi:CheY-like chemotaxis protein